MYAVRTYFFEILLMITLKFSVLVKDMRVVSKIFAVKNAQENIEHEKCWKGETLQTPDLVITNL